MSRSSPAVSLVLVLALVGVPIASTACEMACVCSAARADANRTLQESAANCHEPLPAVANQGGDVSLVASHAACGHEGSTEPFLLSAASGAKLRALRETGQHWYLDAIGASGSPLPLHGRTPPGPTVAYPLPLRI